MKKEDDKMFFNHENIINKSGSFVICKRLFPKANKIIDNLTLKELWHNFSFKSSELEIIPIKEIHFSIGSAKQPLLKDSAYAINVESNGIFIAAATENDLIRGFITLLDLMQMNENGIVEIKCCEIHENPFIERRMTHFCIFPDTDLWEIEKFVRICGSLKYSHIILESWGMIKFDCLKELSWSHAFEKSEIKPIIQLANEMGIEIIPMFNHWGHASAGRVCHGKHVILDQNPSLQYLFSENGWCWNYKSHKVKKLLEQIRRELISLCGNGEYFHIGCDEAYGFEYNETSIIEICEYINGISNDLHSLNRKTIMWADMLLYKNEKYIQNNYCAAAPNKAIETKIISLLNKNIIMADWQYWVKQPPVETSIFLKDAGFNVLLCPWDESLECSNACLETVKKYKLYGILHTTWHTLSDGYPYLGYIASACWSNYNIKDMTYPYLSTKTAEIMRKSYFPNGDYKKSGWAKYEISVRW